MFLKAIFPSFLFIFLLLTTGCHNRGSVRRRAPEKPKSSKNEYASFDELSKKADHYVKLGKKREAINVLSEIMAHHKDHKNVNEYRLNLAQLYFEKELYDLADEQYRAFLRTTPSQGELASYRSILCKYNQTLSIDRDPTPLNKTIKRCKKHLDNPLYNDGPHVQDVRDILYTCERKLIDREVYTFNFYLKQADFDSAKRRLKDVEAYCEKHADLAPRLSYLKTKLAEAQNNKEEMFIALKELKEQHPNSTYYSMAERVAKPYLLDIEDAKEEPFLF